MELSTRYLGLTLRNPLDESVKERPKVAAAQPKSVVTAPRKVPTITVIRGTDVDSQNASF